MASSLYELRLAIHEAHSVRMASLLESLQHAAAPAFTVERKLGEGGMGVVYLGHDVSLDRPVAFKVLKPEQATARAAERFVREARTLAKLSHPHVVRVYLAPDPRAGLFYYIMEYISGETVADRLSRGPMPPSEAVSLGADLLSGLEAVHRLGVVHRDVKPSNVFLFSERAVLADFGIAQPSDSESLTNPGEIVGTLRYMAPEQLASDGRVDLRADLYSAAVVLFEALTGRMPRPGGPAKPINWSGVPRRLRRVLRRGLALEPERRWPSAAEFRRALVRPWLLSSREIGTAALLTLGAVWLSLWLSGGTYTSSPEPRSDIAVVPFESADHGAVGRDLARYASDRLQWFPRWTMKPIALTFAWADTVPEAVRQERGPHELKSTYVVLGRVIDGSSGSTLELTLRDSSGRALNPIPIRVASRPDDLPGWSRDVADSIVARVFPGLAGPFHELSRRTVADAQAYGEYFKGEEAFQQDAYEEADHHYARALERDPGFVQAALRLAIVRRFRRVPFESDLKRLYDEDAAELPEQHRQLIEALLEPDLRRRFQRYRLAVSAFPHDATVRFVYADELFHRGPLVGIPLDTAMAELYRVTSLQPDLEQAPAFDHLLWGHLRLGDRELADSTLRRRLSLPYSGEGEETRRRRFLQLAYDQRFRPGIAALKRLWLSFRADSAMLEGMQRYARLGNSFDIPQAELALGRILTERGRTRTIRGSGHRAEGIALMMFGRPGEALGHLDTAIAWLPRPDSLLERAEWRMILPALGFPAGDSASRSSARAHLVGLSGTADLGPRAAWILAVAAAHDRDTTASTRWAATVDRLAAGHRGAARLALGLTAMVAASRGHPDSALVVSQPLLAYDSTGVEPDPFARAILHLQRARWHLALADTLGADAELRWYENSDSGIEGWLQGDLQPGEVDAMVSAVARLDRSRLALARADSTTACALASRVRELWERAEPAYASLKADARAIEAACLR